MIKHSNIGSPNENHGKGEDGTAFTAICRDFGFAWQWEIYEGDEQIHCGAALSEAAARRTVAVVSKAFDLCLEESRIVIES